MPVWPEALPQKMNVSGFSESGIAGFAESGVSSGPAFRRLQSPEPQKISGTQQLSKEQCEIFVQFYVNGLRYGLLTFDWINQRTGEPARLRFAKQAPYVFRPQSGLLWTATYNLELMSP